ncbi:hypothetical protein [Sphingobacterium sp. BIGb0165]|uniref:hypothetical protein n=1 Tax=Sphingobacterium sp. BIGb0165 TaxID=2940615 RepID=UPI00216AAC44|nr:hypothetical protein [Sphingobacterium sp. BIGb0165]MCS4226900.1 hypothetical protein [Sphingobacterium sp. BIGb0165]
MIRKNITDLSKRGFGGNGRSLHASIAASLMVDVIKKEDVMKLSCRQLDFAQENPKGMAQMLKQNNFIKGGFNKVTQEVCYSLAKGIVDYNDAKVLLEIRLRESFKDNKTNRKRRELCQVVLYNFYTFLMQEGLSIVLNYSEINLRLKDGHMIGGHSCCVYRLFRAKPIA